MNKGKIIENIDNLPFNANSVTMVSGYFDLLHSGHVKFLEKCKNIGNPLLVVVLSDSICKVKNPNRPVINEKDRAYIISKLGFVDYVIIGNQRAFDNNGEFYKKTSPKVVVFSTGEPHANGKNIEIDILNQNFPKIKVHYIKRQRNDISTSQIIEKILTTTI